MPDLAKEHTEVLIVGAGPVGLFLANECARRGVRYRIIERRLEQSQHSKALALMPRTLEIFDMAGLAAPFLAAANRVSWIRVQEHDRLVARIPFAPEDTPYPFVAMVPQDVTEKLLVAALGARGGAVEYGVSFLSSVERASHLEVKLDCGGTEKTVQAAFVVGCDGAHSSVRHELALPFEGSQYPGYFMLADLATNEILPGDEMQLCPDAHGPLAIFPMSTTRRRLVATVDKADADAPDLSLVQELLKARAPTDLAASGLHWSSYFRIHHRQVAQLRSGRHFIAGDAAHIHSPIGGQGMNTGLHDAWNLAWRLPLALRGMGNDTLLNGYSSERRAQIRRVVSMTHFMTRAMSVTHPLLRTLRNTLIRLASRTAPLRRRIVRRLAQLDIRYRLGALPQAGCRVFDETLRGGQGLVNRFILLVPEHTGSDVVAAAEALLRESADLIEVRRHPADSLWLVRPDGYLVGTGRPSAQALDQFRAYFRSLSLMR